MNRTLRNLAMAAAGAAAATTLYALYVEPRWLQCTRTRMHFARLPASLEGLRIALLTDLHAGRDTPEGLIARAVRMTMRERPDFIAITGDVAESEALLESTLDELAKLRAPLGVYIVPGNHDYRDIGIGRWHDAVARRPELIDLTNRAHVLEIPVTADGLLMTARAKAPAATDTVRLCVAGVDDLDEGRPRLDAMWEHGPRDFTVLLAHNPDQAERARRGMDRVDLVLSGHTHGGQVRLPWIGAIVNSAAHADLYEAGVRRRPWTQVYTSRGIGTVHLPVRFLTRPEVAIVTLSASPRAPENGWARWSRPMRQAAALPQRLGGRGAAGLVGRIGSFRSARRSAAER